MLCIRCEAENTAQIGIHKAAREKHKSHSSRMNTIYLFAAACTVCICVHCGLLTPHGVVVFDCVQHGSGILERLGKALEKWKRDDVEEADLRGQMVVKVRGSGKQLVTNRC